MPNVGHIVKPNVVYRTLEYMAEAKHRRNAFRNGTVTEGFKMLSDEDYLVQRFKYYGEHSQAKTMSFEEYLDSLDNIITVHAARKAEREAPRHVQPR